MLDSFERSEKELDLVSPILALTSFACCRRRCGTIRRASRRGDIVTIRARRSGHHAAWMARLGHGRSGARMGGRRRGREGVGRGGGSVSGLGGRGVLLGGRNRDPAHGFLASLVSTLLTPAARAVDHTATHNTVQSLMMSSALKQNHSTARESVTYPGRQAQHQ